MTEIMSNNTNTNNNLSNTPSRLLRQAVGDVLHVIKRGDIGFNMREWVRKSSDGTCTVCVAGACMFRRINVDDFPKDYFGDIFINPSDLEHCNPDPASSDPASSDPNVQKYRALNSYRSGCYSDFFKYLGIYDVSIKVLGSVRIRARVVRGNVTNDVMLEFCQRTLEVADYLEAAGL